MSNSELLYESIYILIPCLLIVFMFYIESKVVTERERETREYFKIFIVSFLLIGIARYCFTFYYNMNSSGTSASDVIKSSKASVGSITKSKSKTSGGSNLNSSETSSPLETISNTVSTIVEKITPSKSVTTENITSSVNKVTKAVINPNLPDF